MLRLSMMVVAKSCYPEFLTALTWIYAWLERELGVAATAANACWRITLWLEVNATLHTSKFSRKDTTCSDYIYVYIYIYLRKGIVQNQFTDKLRHIDFPTQATFIAWGTTVAVHSFKKQLTFRRVIKPFKFKSKMKRFIHKALIHVIFILQFWNVLPAVT